MWKKLFVISDYIFTLSVVALVLLAVLIIVMILMLGRMNQRLKEFLNQNAQETNDIQELLIDFCDEIGGKVDDMNHSVSGHIQVMKKEKKAL